VAAAPVLWAAVDPQAALDPEAQAGQHLQKYSRILLFMEEEEEGITAALAGTLDRGLMLLRAGMARGVCTATQARIPVDQVCCSLAAVEVPAVLAAAEEDREEEEEEEEEPVAAAEEVKAAAEEGPHSSMTVTRLTVATAAMAAPAHRVQPGSRVELATSAPRVVAEEAAALVAGRSRLWPRAL
jgi:hypothetical protein